MRQYALDYGADGIRANAVNADRIRSGLLTSELIAALGKTDRGSLFTRVSPATLSNKMSQLTRTMDLTEKTQA